MEQYFKSCSAIAWFSNSDYSEWGCNYEHFNCTNIAWKSSITSWKTKKPYYLQALAGFETKWFIKWNQLMVVIDSTIKIIFAWNFVNRMMYPQIPIRAYFCGLYITWINNPSFTIFTLIVFITKCIFSIKCHWKTNVPNIC